MPPKMVLVHICPVLNFLLRQIINKADKDAVVKLAAKFFGKGAFKATIEVCRDIFKVGILESHRESHPNTAFMVDFYELNLENSNVKFPR